MTFGQTNWTQLTKPNNMSTAIINQAIRRRRIRQPHSTSNIKPLRGAEGLLFFCPLSSKDYPTLFLYLILTLEKTNQTEYLKPNNMSTAIINQAIRRSRIRQSHSASNMKSLPGAEGLFVLSRKDHPTLFLYLILTLEKTNQTEYLKPNNLSTAFIDQAIRRSRIGQPNPTPAWNLCLEK